MPPAIDPASITRVVWRADHAAFVTGDTFVQIWERSAPRASFEAIRRHCREWRARSADRPMWMMSVVAERSDVPDADARRVAADLPLYFTHFVLVVEGSGFRAALVRGAMTGIQLLSRRRSAYGTASTVLDAARELEQKSGGAVDAAALDALVAHVRGELATAPSGA